MRILNRKWLASVVTLLAVAGIMSCSDQGPPPTGLVAGSTSTNDMAQPIDPMFVTAPANLFCIPGFTNTTYYCYQDAATTAFVATLGHPQVAPYCGDPYNSQFCNFALPGSAPGAFDGDNPNERDPAADAYDMKLTPRPKCPVPATAPKGDQVWCNAKKPADFNNVAAQRIADALAKMKLISDNCKYIASVVENVMAAGDGLRIYPITSYPAEDGTGYAGGFANNDVLGGGYGDAYIGVGDAFINNAYTKSRQTRPTTPGEDPMWLQRVLAHEADHLLGIPHLPGSKTLTENTVECGG